MLYPLSIVIKKTNYTTFDTENIFRASKGKLCLYKDPKNVNQLFVNRERE